MPQKIELTSQKVEIVPQKVEDTQPQPQTKKAKRGFKMPKFRKPKSKD